MENGFSYRGIHCSEFGLHYVPDSNEIRNRMEDYEVSSMNPAAKHGGYYIHSIANEKEFKIDCYFENMEEKIYAELLEWLRRDQFGELIFDDRPYVIYDVWPTKSVKPQVFMARAENG